MKRINITGNLMYVIWYSPFLQEAPSTMLFFLHLLLAESISSMHDMSSSTMTYDHHLHVDTKTIASIYSTNAVFGCTELSSELNWQWKTKSINSMEYHKECLD